MRRSRRLVSDPVATRLVAAFAVTTVTLPLIDATMRPTSVRYE